MSDCWRMQYGQCREPDHRWQQTWLQSGWTWNITSSLEYQSWGQNPQPIKAKSSFRCQRGQSVWSTTHCAEPSNRRQAHPAVGNMCFINRHRCKVDVLVTQGTHWSFYVLAACTAARKPVSWESWLSVDVYITNDFAMESTGFMFNGSSIAFY